MLILKRFIIALAISLSIASTAYAEPQIVSDAMKSSEWIARALNNSGYNADFSLESLKEIDRFLDEHSKNGTAVEGGLLSRDLGPRLFALGCYTGEVIRKHAGGKWDGDDSDPNAEINIQLTTSDGTVMWPVQRIIKRYKFGKEDSVYAYGVTATAPHK